ncbi:SPOSA6832_01132, partial [Sporobolomyces salmonicolor]
MLDQLAGKPSPSWRRSQVFLVLLFWISRIAIGDRYGPRFFWIRRLNRALAKCTPWQIVLSTLTVLYALRHGDVLLGLQAPEPLARLYSRDYYRATWIVTALDAGFATAMTVKYKWLRDVFSLMCSGYYLLFANEADEKLRKYRAICTVEMLRTTWEKTSNPYIRFFTRRDRPRVGIRRKIFLPRPQGSKYTFVLRPSSTLSAAELTVRGANSKPMTAYLFFAGSELELARQRELVMDFPGGGFICMNPQHHEERLLRWAIQTGRPVLSFDYGKAPEYPFPFAIDEMYDAYSLLHGTKGKCIGMNTVGEQDLRVVLSGDSAGANIATAMLSHPDVANLLRGKEHLEHLSPLSVVEDVERRSGGSERGRPKVLRRKRTISWGRGLVRGLPGSKSFASLRGGTAGTEGDDEEEQEEVPVTDEKDKTLSERIVWWEGPEEAGVGLGAGDEARQRQLKEKLVEEEGKVKEELAGRRGTGSGGALEQTRLAMTSRTAFFNDRIISPSMCRAMALLYIGPRNAPDLHSDYHISPIFTPPHLLHQFPPVYLSCGERDPFVDDVRLPAFFRRLPSRASRLNSLVISVQTVIFAGKLREAKESRKLELLARETRHGESLRMSGSAPSTPRDPILDEDEDDWVRSSIIEGWSHGYLQMVSVLPESTRVIAMMGDWINEAFERAEAKEKKNGPGGRGAGGGGGKPHRPGTPSPLASNGGAHKGGQVGSPSRTIKIMPPLPIVPPLFSAGLTSESEHDEDILSFTPKRRRGSSNVSRSGSPAPNLAPQTARRASGTASALVAPTHSSSDEASSSSTTLPRTPDDSQTLQHSTSPSRKDEVTPPPRHQHLVTPVERAMRDDLPTSPPTSKPHNPSSSSQSASANAHARRFFTDPATALAIPQRPSAAQPVPGSVSLSDDEQHLSVTSAWSSGEADHPSAVNRKTARSGSAGLLPVPIGAHFVDAKDLLRRRRDEVVFGISAASSRPTSTDGSEGDDQRGDEPPAQVREASKAAAGQSALDN